MFRGNENDKKSNSLIAIVGSEQAHKEIEFVMAKLPQVAASVKKTDDTLRDASKLVNGSADVVIIEADLADEKSDPVLKKLCEYVSQNGFLIVLAENATPASTRSMFKAGVNDVLPLPLERADLLASLESAFGSLVAKKTNYQTRGKVITLLKCGGGSGSTTLATNIAHTIMQGGSSKRSRKNSKDSPAIAPRVAVFDFDIQFGTVALGLNVDNRANILDARKAESRLDASLLASAIRTHGSGLNILASPDDIVPFTAFSSDFFEKIIEIGRAMYDYVVIDMPQAWTSWTHTVLDNSDIIMPVLYPSVEHVHNAQKILIGLDHMKINRDKTLIAINKVPKGLSAKDRIAQIKKITDRSVVIVHEDIKTNASARDQGKLLSEITSGSTTVKDIVKCTEQIIKHLNTVKTTPAPGAYDGDQTEIEQRTGL